MRLMGIRGWCCVPVVGLIAILLATSASAEVAQSGRLRVTFEGKVRPQRLPRHGVAPVTVAVGGRVSTVDGSVPKQLQRIEIAINRAGRIDPTGLPVCRYEDIQPSTTAGAQQACGPAMVGKGAFLADVAIPEQSPFPAKGEMVLFNGREHGQPILLAHVYGTEPVPTSYTLPLRITQTRGTFGTVLSGTLPDVTSKVAFVTGMQMTIGRTYRHRGGIRSYLSAGCPAPKGFGGATFPFARASFGFKGGMTLSSTMRRSCGVRK